MARDRVRARAKARVRVRAKAKGDVVHYHRILAWSFDFKQGRDLWEP